MTPRLASRSIIATASRHEAPPARRFGTMASPFRELRPHLAAVHRILNRDYPGRGEISGAIAIRLNEALCALARTARNVGLTTYCSLALHVLEQLSPGSRTRYLSNDARELVLEWARLSWLYLLAPANPVHAHELVTHMGNLRWERAVCRVQRDLLFESLQTETHLLTMARAKTTSPQQAS